jgi:hypothetical protein
VLARMLEGAASQAVEEAGRATSWRQAEIENLALHYEAGDYLSLTSILPAVRQD